MIRVSFIIPSNVSNYVLGGTAVTFKDFTLGTSGTLPLVIFSVYVGSTMSNMMDYLDGKHSISTVEIVLSVLGGIAALIGLIITSVVVKRTLDNEIKRSKQVQDEKTAAKNAA